MAKRKKLSPARLAEEQDFQRRMTDAAADRAAAKAVLEAFHAQEKKDFAVRLAVQRRRRVPNQRTARYKIANSFKPGRGKLS